MSEEKKTLSMDELEEVAGGLFGGRVTPETANDLAAKVNEILAKLPTLEEINALVKKYGIFPFKTLNEAKAWVKQNILMLLASGILD